MISVCIPTYNGQSFIKQQLDSILVQLSDTDEVIISDDSSTDDTIKIIESYNDKRIKIFKDNKYKSSIYNLENALTHSIGDIIFTADQDDVWLPNKVSTMLQYLTDYDMVICDAKIIDGQNNIISDSFYNLNHSKNGLINNLIKNGYFGPCMAFKRKVLDKALPFPKNLPMHDPWLGYIAAAFGKTIFIKDKLVLYRRHGTNVSSAAEKSKFSLLKKLQIRYTYVYNIIKRRKM